MADCRGDSRGLCARSWNPAALTVSWAPPPEDQSGLAGACRAGAGEWRATRNRSRPKMACHGCAGRVSSSPRPALRSGCWCGASSQSKRMRRRRNRRGRDVGKTGGLEVARRLSSAASRPPVRLFKDSARSASYGSGPLGPMPLALVQRTPGVVPGGEPSAEPPRAVVTSHRRRRRSLPTQSPS